MRFPLVSAPEFKGFPQYINMQIASVLEDQIETKEGEITHAQ